MKTSLRLLTIFSCALIFWSCGDSPTAQLKKASRLVYVTNEASGDLSIIDASNNRVITTLKLGKRPRGIQLSPDRKLLYVALSGSPFAPPGVDEDSLPPPDKSADGIGIVDTERNTLLKVMPGGSDPEQFPISPDGGKLYIANEDAGLCSIINTATGEVIKTLAVGEEPEGVGISPDGKLVYVTSENNGLISVIETAGDTLVTTLKVGRRPRVAAFLPDGSRAYISLENDSAVAVVDTAKHTLLKTIH